MLVHAQPEGDTDAAHNLRDAVTQVLGTTRRVIASLGAVDLKAEVPGNADEVRKVLRRERPTIVHYIGYGRFAQGADQIAVSSHGPDPTYVGAEELAALLEHGEPRVAVLQLCDARPAMPGVRGDLTTFAPEVLGRRVEALVGYQYPAEKEYAECFNECFYKKVAAGAAVELAVQEARTALALKAPDGRAFLAPAVTVRQPGGLRLVKVGLESSSRQYVGAAGAYG